ncbi:MAG: HesA/MoeB/ThiF family protein [Bacteroidales bacterium]|nr:HesA/MoeB/ThiF family protein [Bacteroidales bacterium]
MPISILNVQELRRYKRHILMSEIGIAGQELLKTAKVLVVGSGGLGIPVLQYLTAAGVGTIGLVDFDKVEESNLQRQVLFGAFDIGKHKTVVLEKKLREQNDFVDFRIHNLYFQRNEITLSIIKQYDIIVDCTDNYDTRYILNDACILANRPLVHGSVVGQEGQVSVFNYENGPSYRCLYPNVPSDKRLIKSSNFGLFGTIAGIIGTIQAHEVIKIITGHGDILTKKLLVFDAFDMESRIFTFDRNDDNFEIESWI